MQFSTQALKNKKTHPPPNIFLIFQEMELSGSKIKNCLIFQEM